MARFCFLMLACHAVQRLLKMSATSYSAISAIFQALKSKLRPVALVDPAPAGILESPKPRTYCSSLALQPMALESRRLRESALRGTRLDLAQDQLQPPGGLQRLTGLRLGLQAVCVAQRGEVLQRGRLLLAGGPGVNLKAMSKGPLNFVV